MSTKARVVAIGGGSGLAMLLRGLKTFPVELSAVVTMTDNGRSSGRLRRDLNVLPPGDVRQCLAALAKDEELLTKLFNYRFAQGRGLSGHSLGNLLLAALADITGDFESAVQVSSKILSIEGEVIPSVLTEVNLVANLQNGQTAVGEKQARVLGHRYGIKNVELSPSEVAANPTAVAAIRHADLIIVGPGSFYSSVVTNFLVKEIRLAFEESRAAKIYVCNASTERGETERFSVEDHVRRLREYVNGTKFDAVLVNSRIVAWSKKEGQLGSVRNITTDQSEVGGMPVVLADVIDDERPLYHSSAKLAQVIWQTWTEIAKQSQPTVLSRLLRR